MLPSGKNLCLGTASRGLIIQVKRNLFIGDSFVFLPKANRLGLWFLISSLVLVSCGKKAQEDSSHLEQNNPQQVSDLEAQLAQQELFCASDRSCPSYILKIAIVNKGKLKFCTGFLTDDNIVATATNCLPENLREKELPCDKDIFFYFAQSSERPVRVGCKKILDVSRIDAQEPFLWRSNVAYLEINSRDNRRSVAPSRAGMSDLDHFYLWTVDQIDEHQGIIRKTEDCQSVHNSYFNPLANNDFSPVMTLAGCEFNKGNSGAPIFDYRGKVRGVVSMPVEERYIDEVLSMRVLQKPLKKLIHVSNFACAPMYPQQEVANENECGKVLNYTTYDQARRSMINESNLFKNSIQKIEHSVNDKNRYIKLASRLIPVDDSYQVDLYPKCFKDVGAWIGEFNNNRTFTFNIEMPNVKLKSSMNEYGRIMALEFARQGVPTNIQFKPSVLRSSRQASVSVWSNGPTAIFPNLNENCGSLF